jgi:toxin-antitoxin system PIN domain toxin
MTAFLLDVNVLVAMSWPGHRFHETALRWFADNNRKGWATCPMVQTGFVKIVSNPAFSPRAVSPKQAIDALNISIQSSTHQFWSDDISVSDVLRIVKGRVAGHQQVNDAYLVALAVQHGGRLATLDRSIAQLGPSDAVEEVT